MTNKYRHIFFDWDNTLWDFSANSEKALSVLFSMYRFERFFKDFETFHKIYSEYNALLWEDYAAGKIKREFLETERFEHPFRVVGARDEEAVEALKTKYLELLGRQTVLRPGAKEILEYLKGKGSKLYIISNGFSAVQHIKIGNSGLQHYFDRIYLSEDIKEHKPKRAFFDYMLKSSNARKRESLVVGDNFTADITGSVNAGIDCVYYAPDYNGEPLNPMPNYIIKNLLELKELI
ncbi:MAG: YjjG family noncanonical pyrimidine nucleotidase [Paludibacteraceae bacterium]|nr:YjjG family noncanonical pyrimidine nucleotidase [Paludibacteraceae bacterium]